MCAVLASTDANRFLVATNSFKKENELHLLNYSEDSNRIDTEAIFNVEQGEVWSMASSPYSRQIVACGI